MTRTVEKIVYDLERARRERDVWKTNRGGQSNNKMACMMVSALEKELSEAVCNQANDAHKTPDSVGFYLVKAKFRCPSASKVEMTVMRVASM
ncbi:hypothetical protein SIL08_18415 [Scandinavium sp. V105_16]|uniref:Uncharacterized protein n=1 Tax=Scandinavium lactucae TaxID=3095028 RepID=A0AAJ2S4L1_9ENTR|nr:MULTISPECIES: hypothetical protein [unclassified Scandinavium]MDX6022254.1 hypothetical protein [Scandinavium sp. V105_16]MDX6033904.1 hypothetical protein [Scandinavium sp. V105_12]